MYIVEGLVGIEKVANNTITLVPPNFIVYNGFELATFDGVIRLYDVDNHCGMISNFQMVYDLAKAGEVIGVFDTRQAIVNVLFISKESYIVAENLEYLGEFKEPGEPKDIGLDLARDRISIVAVDEDGAFIGTQVQRSKITTYHAPHFIGEAVILASTFSLNDYKRFLRIRGDILELFSYSTYNSNWESFEYVSKVYRYKYCGLGTLSGFMAQLKLKGR